METANSPYTDDEERAKLIPEWGVSADSQVVLAGLAALLALVGAFFWNAWRDGDEDLATVGSSVLADPGSALGDASAANGGAATPVIAPGVTAAQTVTTAAAAVSTTTPSTTAPSTTAAGPSAGDVQAAVAGLPGDITGSLDGSTAVLEGFVANDGESAEAETAAAAVDGVDEVDNQLVTVEPGVMAVLDDAGVVGPTAAGVGTAVTVTGTLQSEEDRPTVIEAAAAVEGVTSIDDQLTVSVAADLNQLPQVQFATGSAEILPVSFPDLDAAADLITTAGEVQLQVVGWTDVQGDEAQNLTLSQDRADAVAAYLAGAGVPADQLTAVGNGETEQFGAGESPEALQANRVVLFEQTG